MILLLSLVVIGQNTMNLFFWRKSNEVQDQAYAPYEEIDAKRTSKLGYFFLILMVIFGVAQGQSFLGAINNSVTRPESNSSCLSTLARDAGINPVQDRSWEYIGGYNYGLNKGDCTFSAREKKFSIDTLYEQIKPIQAEISSTESQISNLRNQYSTLERNRKKAVSEYDVSLQEEMAVTPDAVFNQGGLQNSIRGIDLQMSQLTGDINRLTRQVENLNAQIKEMVMPYTNSIQSVYDTYSHDVTWYKFKQFMLSLLLVAPLFFFAWHLYHRSKSQRSEYTIIWGGVVATVGIIFAQILLVFVYEILPKEILQKLFDFLAVFEFLWVILYWLGFILVPLFFGFLIYLIQKKFYNKRAVMMRALKSEHCPHCSLKINLGMNHCPVCGYTLKTKCTSCGAMSMKGGSFCQECGVKHDEIA